MVKKLLILGDSFCHGTGTVTPFKNEENTNYAFGKFVADHLKLDYLNLAEPGSAILRATEVGYQYLKDNKDQIDMVIIGWTSPRRVGLYSTDSMLQILPGYSLLGDNADDDVFVEYDNSVKFVTNNKNQQHLPTLAKMHRIMVENNLFEGQDSVSNMAINCFRAWLEKQQIKYIDFNVFTNSANPTVVPITFNDIMIPSRHPTKAEQQQFAELFIKNLI